MSLVVALSTINRWCNVCAMTSPSTAPSARRSPVEESELGAWRAFIQTHARLLHRLDEELQASHGLSLAEYDALLQLVTAPDHRLRMSMLAERVLLSRSGITRLVDRLVADGMVERFACPTDARGSMAAITQTGVSRLRAASKTHLEGVRRYFLDVVTLDEQATIERALGHVNDGLSGKVLGEDSSCTAGLGS
jgi:DNA-binding MarR family transcriptional regulator